MAAGGDLAQLKPDRANANRGTVRGRALLEDSLRRYGAGRSILADKHGNVIAGNKTLDASADIGLPVRIIQTDGTELVVVQRTDLDLDTDKAARELAYADNRIASLDLDWDVEQLLADRDAGIDLAAVGFDADELAALLAGIGDDPAEGLTDPDAVPPVPADPITKPGDLWTLGRHRLACIDSTYADQMAGLMAGARADLVFTDPPYGVNVTGKGGRAIAGDLSFTLIPMMFDVLPALLAPGAWLYICGGQSNTALYSRLFERYFRQLPHLIVWDKGNTAVMRHSGYHSCYELIYFAFLEGGGHRWLTPRTSEHADDIWRVPVGPENARVHPTEKPVELPARAIRNTCPPEGTVLDPFGGSGSTLIAAEQSGRVAYLAELDPAYCDVIVTRWQDFTGLEARRA